MNKSTIQKVSAATLLVALGIIYGDIGTSPLYVMKAIIKDREITQLLVYGGVSCIFWTLTFQTTIKYIFLTLSADNHGEGGVFSLYALVKRFGKGKLVIPTILGATTLLADGIITPPISVASAVEGLGDLVPGIPTLPIVIVSLSGLFFFQRFGTQKVGFFFVKSSSSCEVESAAGSSTDDDDDDAPVIVVITARLLREETNEEGVKPSADPTVL